ncbi:MAG: response regulator [Vicinamibacteria bacterium]|nr:response regulator [Vicinamibacteria bacterium]
MATILIVDDLPANRTFLVTLLRHHGHRLIEAADGSQGLAAVRAEHPDLVITDVLMPVMDGYEFVKHLRLDPATSGIPVVFSTAHYGEREARALALSSGVAWVLTKPAESEEVLAIVGRVLSGESEAGTSAAARPLSTEFDREHLRLLTDKLSEKAGDLRATNTRLKALINIGLELASEKDPGRLLQSVCAAARELFSATYVTVGLLDPNDRTVQRLLCLGADAPGWVAAGDSLPGILATAVTERRTLRGDNPGGDPARLLLPALHPEIQAFLAAPFASPVHVYGWICLVGNEGNAFTEDDEQLVTALAGQVGRVYESIALCAAAQHRADDLQHEVLERKQAETALAAAGVGIWDMDCTARLVRWSRTLEAQYGLRPGAFGGTVEAFVALVHPDDRESALEVIGKAMKSGDEFSLQSRAVRVDGTVRWLHGVGRFQLGQDGEPVRGAGISVDITERRALEAQYQQAQKMEAIGRLAGGVAHDFNNSMTAILGYCELLQADLDPGDPRQADIAEIQKAGISAVGLTRQLLAFSRKEIIEPTLLDLGVVVSDMRAMLSRLIGEDVKVVLGLAPGLALVKVDRSQMDQVIMNLALNARDAMPGGGTLTIETANVELDENFPRTHLDVKPGHYVVLTVADTGTGMTPQAQAHLFEPFFTTKAPGKGTGLGLATVHGIIARSGGSVSVYSEIGRGTSIKVYFPAVDGGEMLAEAPPRVVRSPGGAETVLVVEDAEGLRELCQRLLQREGYTVLVAANADDALRLFDEHASIDVLLTDVVMPGASGPDLARQLVQRRPALKVIYMSGYTDDAITHHGIVDPGIAFVQKPFTSATLGLKIREVLDR